MQEIVLVVDDDEGIRDVLSAFLKIVGYDVLAAASGREALQLLTDCTPHPRLIFLDQMMPDMDGLAFAQELHARDFSIPLIACSASGQTREFAAQINAVGYIEKPFHISKLQKDIEIWMKDLPV